MLVPFLRVHFIGSNRIHRSVKLFYNAHANGTTLKFMLFLKLNLDNKRKQQMADFHWIFKKNIWLVVEPPFAEHYEPVDQCV